MSDPFVGEIMTVGFSFPPRGWATCSGQLLAISSNTALFSLLGTTYGGDGRTTFGLPDLRGRSVVGVGNGPGLSNVSWGQKGGAQSHVLPANAVPTHTHTASLHGETAIADKSNPNNKMLALSASNIYAAPVAAENRTMAAESIVVNPNTGGGAAFSALDPYLGLYINIALVGVYPSRN